MRDDTDAIGHLRTALDLTKEVARSNQLTAERVRDAMDLIDDAGPPTKPPPTPPVTDATLDAIGVAARREGFQAGQFNAWVKATFGVAGVRELTERDGQAVLAVAESDQFMQPIIVDPPTEWAPPHVGLDAIPLTPNECPTKTTWAGTRVQLSSSTKDVHLADTEVSKISGSGEFNAATFDNVLIRNEDNSQYSVGVSDSQPSKTLITDEDTWENSDYATPYRGIMVFTGCRFDDNPGTAYHGKGGKMHLHPQSNASFSLRDCYIADTLEHGFYGEWLKSVEILRTEFEPCGGAAIQVASRAGHGPVGNYQHGNPFNPPAGLNGYANLRDITIREEFWDFRDAADIQFVGFLGPIVMERIRCLNTIGAVAIWADIFKGAWLYKDDRTKPVRWRRDVEGKVEGALGLETVRDLTDKFWIPKDHYAAPEVWIDDLSMTYSSNGLGRGALTFAGVEEVHLGRLSVPDSPFPAIIFDNWYGGGLPNKRRPGTDLPNVYFYDRETVERLAGRIGTEVPHPTQPGKGKFKAYTMEELEQLIV